MTAVSTAGADLGQRPARRVAIPHGVWRLTSPVPVRPADQPDVGEVVRWVGLGAASRTKSEQQRVMRCIGASGPDCRGGQSLGAAGD